MPANFNIVLFDTKGQTIKSVTATADTKILSLEGYRSMGAVRAEVTRTR